jgi:hypothetical protein
MNGFDRGSEKRVATRPSCLDERNYWLGLFAWE